MDRDIALSVQRIETEVGVTPVFFAYPHGEVEPMADGILSRYFRVTVTTDEGCADISNGLYHLPWRNITDNASVGERISAE